MECTRTACDATRDIVCRHTYTDNLYCIKCARGINEHNPGLVVIPQAPFWRHTMHIELYEANSTADKDAIARTEDRTMIDLAGNKPVPQIFLDVEEVEERSGTTTGAEVVEIQVINTDGCIGKFWLDVRTNKQGRPVLITTTNVGNETHTKKLTGSWRL